MSKRPVVKTSQNTAAKLTRKATQDSNHCMQKASQIITTLGEKQATYMMSTLVVMLFSPLAMTAVCVSLLNKLKERKTLLHNETDE